MVSIVHATTAVGTDSGTGEIHKAQWDEDHLIVGDLAGALRARAKQANAQTLTTGATTALLFDAEDYDSSSLHFLSAAALTGTVTTTSGSPTMTGSGTLFTSELSVNQVIQVNSNSLAQGTTELYAVLAIASDTSLTLARNATASRAGVSATRRNTAMAIPATKGGLYAVGGQVTIDQNATGSRRLYIYVNGATLIASESISNIGGSTGQLPAVNVNTQWEFAAGDVVELYCFHDGSANLNTRIALTAFWLAYISA